MSLNKFMHPRNKYRKPPDFKALAIKYPEFRKHAKQDISGKIKFNFKDLEAVRVLTSTLLKEDFDLDVDIPSSRLIPTLPLRLNYLLWLEDIVQVNEPVSDTVKGVDIGCGASCVYPLLAAKHFGWHMLATEVDTDSAFMASSNVRKNKLQNMIKVRSVKEDTMLDGVLDADTVYNFCMCNPPFFSTEEELDPEKVARSPSRPLPRNAHSGARGELVFEGGELAFVNKIIQDSLKLKGKIKVYSVMVGHKTTVSKLKRTLQEVGVTQVATSEFCQGHTMRWGVAWTLEENVSFPQSEAPSRKKKAPYSFSCEMDMTTTVEKLQQLMKELQMAYSTLKTNQELFAMEITAEKNTWSNSRKKRRQEKNKQTSSSDDNVSKEPTAGVDKTEDCNKITATNGIDSEKASECNVLPAESSKSDIITNVEDSPILNRNQNNENKLEEKSNKRKQNEDDEESSSVGNVKKPRFENCSPQPTSSFKKDVFLCCSLIVKTDPKGSLVEVNWLRGAGGREAAHQVLHFFKNNLETH